MNSRIAELAELAELAEDVPCSASLLNSPHYLSNNVFSTNKILYKLILCYFIKILQYLSP